MIIILPKHDRDENRMLADLASVREDSKEGILSIRFHQLTRLEIRKLPVLRPAETIDSRLRTLHWPSLAFPNLTDAGHIRRVGHLVRHLRRRFGRVSAVCIGDSHQATTPLVKQLLKDQQSKLVLSPEGVGVFRSKYGGYRWVRVTKFQALRRFMAWLVFGGSFSSSNGGNGLSRVGALWVISHLFHVAVGRTPRSLDHLTVPHVDLAISPWSGDVDYGISAASSVVPDLGSAALLRWPDNAQAKRGLAVFVTQPIDLSFSDWLTVLAPLGSLGISRIIIKERSTEEKTLTAAIRASMPETELEVVVGGLAENLIAERCPEFVVGITSTVFLNLTFLGCRSRLISVSASLACISSPAETFLGHQLEAIRAVCGPSLEIV